VRCQLDESAAPRLLARGWPDSCITHAGQVATRQPVKAVLTSFERVLPMKTRLLAAASSLLDALGQYLCRNSDTYDKEEP